MNPRILIGLILGIFALHICHGDQLAYLDKPEAIRVAEDLRKREIIITYCSECDSDTLELWLVSHAEAHYTGHGSFFEVLLTARPLLRSTEALNATRMKNGADLKYAGSADRKLRSIPLDLAYTYLLVDDEWVCAGLHFGMPCEVSLERFQL